MQTNSRAGTARASGLRRTCAGVFLFALWACAVHATSGCPGDAEWHAYPYGDVENELTVRAVGELALKSETSGSLHYHVCDLDVAQTLSWQWQSSGRWNPGKRPVDITDKETGDRRMALWVGFEQTAGSRGAFGFMRDMLGIGKWPAMESAPELAIIYTWADGYEENVIHHYESGGGKIVIVAIDGRTDGGAGQFRAFERDLECDYLAVKDEKRRALPGPDECVRLKSGGTIEHRVSAIAVSADSEYTGSSVTTEVSGLSLRPRT